MLLAEGHRFRLRDRTEKLLHVCLSIFLDGIGQDILSKERS